MSATTRRAVQEAAVTLGYYPSPSAAALTTGRTNTVGMIAPWVSRWFFSAVVEGAQEILIQQGYDLMLFPTGVRGRRQADMLDARSLEKRVDGLLALNVPFVDLDVMRSVRVPVVTVGSAIPSMSGVLVDNVEVGRLATAHLLDLGHRRIAFLGNESEEVDGFTVSADRYHGYQTALADIGIELGPSLVEPSGFSVSDGEAAFHRLYVRAGGASGLPSAVFAVSDEVAMGALFAARSRGLAVPGDLSVIGVDGHDMAYLFDLSTVSQPVRDQGRIAARLLAEQIASPQTRTPTVVTVGCELIRRGTTAPA